MEFEEQLREYACIGDEEGVRQMILKQGVNVNSQNAVNAWLVGKHFHEFDEVGTSYIVSD